MFFLKELKTLATRKLQEKLKGHWMSDSFPECIREVYSTTSNTDQEMRPAVVEVATAYAQHLGKKEIFKNVLQEGGDFAVDYVVALTKKLSTVR
jgi:hypothetical protein